MRRRARGGGGLTCVGARRRCLEWQDGRMGGWEGGKGAPFRERRREEGREGGRGDAAGRTRENESVERGGRRTDELRARPRRSAWQPTPPPPARAFPQTSSSPRFSSRQRRRNVSCETFVRRKTRLFKPNRPVSNCLSASQRLFAPRAILPLTQRRRHLSAAAMQTATSIPLASHAAQMYLSCKMFHVKHSYASNDNAAPRSHKRATDAAPPSPAPSPCPRSPLAQSPSTLAVRAPAPIRRHDPAQGLSHPRSSAISMPTSPSIRAPPVHPSSQPAYLHPTNHHAQPSVPHRPHAQPSVPHRPSQPEHPRARQPSRPEHPRAREPPRPECSHAICLRNPEDWTKVLYI